MMEQIAYKTEQEEFWAGEFGTEYIGRNKGDGLLASNLYFFSKIMNRMYDWDSMIEFGANVGMNLKAISLLKPNIKEISAIEINNNAVKELEKLEFINKVYSTSILDFEIDYKRDFVLAKGILIHINPNALNVVYQKLYETANKYICIAEYYNPFPIELSYRGNAGKLFKRDFAGELLDKYSDLQIVDYGFAYHRDNNFPQDDINWFLLKKKEAL